MFEAAFGTPEITMERICKAIAQFIRTLNSTNSKFDKYLRGEAQLSDDEMRGYVLFTTEEGADCFHCHGGSGNALFSTYSYLNNGLDATIENVGDRFSYTQNPLDKGAYKVPTLRNIAQTAPYMHDGRFTTLEQVIDQYSEGVKESATISPLMHHASKCGVQLTAQEKIYLKAFLLTLTDTE
ncbi:MAG: cytochrome c peroxidase, partial [Bacteroidales bacterium]